MLDRVTGMQVFVRVAALGSFSAAGRALGLSQTGVTKHVAALEARLGARLLHRTTRRLTLTEAGRTYLEACERILAEIAEAEAGIGAEALEARGTLRLNVPLSFGVRRIAPALAAFCAAHPAVTVELSAQRSPCRSDRGGLGSGRTDRAPGRFESDRPPSRPLPPRPLRRSRLPRPARPAAKACGSGPAQLPRLHPGGGGTLDVRWDARSGHRDAAGLERRGPGRGGDRGARPDLPADLPRRRRPAGRHAGGPRPRRPARPANPRPDAAGPPPGQDAGLPRRPDAALRGRAGLGPGLARTGAG